MSLTSLYYNPARPDDPRPALAVKSDTDTRVFLFEDGIAPDEDWIQDLRDLLVYGEVAILEAHVGPVLDLMSLESVMRHNLDPATEVRLRVLTGRARKETPYAPPVANLSVEEDQDPAEEPDQIKGSYLSRAVECLQGYGLTVPARLKTGRTTPETPDWDTNDDLPDLDDLRVRASDEALPEPVGFDVPDDLFAVTDQDVELFIEELESLPGEEDVLPDDLDMESDLDMDWEDIVESLGPAGPDTSPVDLREELPRPDLTPKPNFWAHLIPEKDRSASLQEMLDALEDPWGVSRAVTGVRAEIHKVMRDPLTYFGPDGHELWAVRIEGGSLDRSEILLQALTDRVEGRMRIRTLSASRSPAHLPLLEDSMRALLKRMTSIEFGAVEALVPEGVRISSDLLRAGGFRHVADLPRWSWGADCALWVLSPRHL